MKFLHFVLNYNNILQYNGQWRDHVHARSLIIYTMVIVMATSESCAVVCFQGADDAIRLKALH